MTYITMFTIAYFGIGFVTALFSMAITQGQAQTRDYVHVLIFWPYRLWVNIREPFGKCLRPLRDTLSKPLVLWCTGLACVAAVAWGWCLALWCWVL